MKGFALGFTLVELVVVIALTGVMAAVAVPRFANGDIFETRGDAGLLSSALRYAQKTAIAQRRNVYAIYSAGVSNTLSLCFDAGCGQAVVNPETAGAYVLTFSKNVNVTPPAGSLGFDSLGRAVPNATTNYLVTNAKNNAQSFNILIEADTGYIH